MPEVGVELQHLEVVGIGTLHQKAPLGDTLDLRDQTCVHPTTETRIHGFGNRLGRRRGLEDGHERSVQRAPSRFTLLPATECDASTLETQPDIWDFRYGRGDHGPGAAANSRPSRPGASRQPADLARRPDLLHLGLASFRESGETKVGRVQCRQRARTSPALAPAQVPRRIHVRNAGS